MHNLHITNFKALNSIASIGVDMFNISATFQMNLYICPFNANKQNNVSIAIIFQLNMLIRDIYDRNS